MSYLGFKVHVENPVSLVHDKKLERFEIESFGIFEVIHQPTRRRYEDVRFLRQHHSLGNHVHSA